MEATITSKGQTTIPKAIRTHLGLEPGDRVKFFLHPDGTVVLLPQRPTASLRGLLRRQGRPVSVAAMHEAVAEGGAAGRPRGR